MFSVVSSMFPSVGKLAVSLVNQAIIILLDARYAPSHNLHTAKLEYLDRDRINDALFRYSCKFNTTQQGEDKVADITENTEEEGDLVPDILVACLESEVGPSLTHSPKAVRKENLSPSVRSLNFDAFFLKNNLRFLVIPYHLMVHLWIHLKKNLLQLQELVPILTPLTI